ncbi:hypothetical protein KI387_016669, partial [Taxus chinensis]
LQRMNAMLSRKNNTERHTPVNTKVVGSSQILTSVFGDSHATAYARSENAVVGGREFMHCPLSLEIQRNYQVAYDRLYLQKIEDRGVNIQRPSSSGNGVKRNHDDMTRHKPPQEENFSSKRSRRNRPQRQKRGVLDESDKNVGAADQSDSTVKLSSGDSDLTAERMAEASSRTTSNSHSNNGCILNPLVNQQSYIATENFLITSSDQGLHKSNTEDGQTEDKSKGLNSSMCNPSAGKEQDWLALQLGCGYGVRQPTYFSSEWHLDDLNNRKTPMFGWNGDKMEDDHGVIPLQMISARQSSNSTTLLTPSSSTIPGQQFSFQYIAGSMSRPVQQVNSYSLHKNSRESSEFTALNQLQPCTTKNHQTSQNIVPFPSAEHMRFILERQQAGVTAWPSKEAVKWQAFYERISEARNPATTDPGKAASSHQGRHSISEGWKSSTTGSAAAPSSQNSGSDGHAYHGGLTDASVVQQERSQCGAQWNAGDNSSSWCQQDTSLGSEMVTCGAKRMLPLEEQQYAPPLERKMPPGPYRENVRIFKPLRASQSGVWFALQALTDQSGDRMLPQIRKNYLRIKDGTMTILVVKKYLVNKLGLNSESE